MTLRRVLVSGAGVAGPALSYWLAVHGWSTTVVERSTELRDAGQNIDVRGAGREVLRRMGLEDAVRAAGTGEVGTQFIGDEGEVIASFDAGENDTDGATAELEILRGELGRLLHERTRDTTEYVFGDEITGLDEHADGVTATFRHGAPRTFDLVVVPSGTKLASVDVNGSGEMGAVRTSDGITSNCTCSAYTPSATLWRANSSWVEYEPYWF